MTISLGYIYYNKYININISNYEIILVEYKNLIYCIVMFSILVS